MTPTCLFLTSAGAVFSYWRKLFSLCTSAPIFGIEVSLVISQLNNSRHNSLSYLQMVLKNIKNSQNFPLVEAPWPVKPSSQIVRDFSEGHELPPAGVSDYKYQMENIAKGTTDPRIEFISQVLTQITSNVNFRISIKH